MTKDFDISQRGLSVFAWIALSLVGAGTLGIIVAGVPLVGYDAYFHLNNLGQYLSVQQSGTIIPRWTPNYYFGFGSATFYFYPPLTYAIASSIFGVVGSVAWSFRFLVLLSMASMFISSRWYLSKLGIRGSAAWLGSLLYAVGPYSFYDFVVRSNFPEYLSLAWVPIVLGSMELLLASKGWREMVHSIAICTIGFSLLVLTSIPMAVAVVFMLIFYLAVRWREHRIIRLWPIVISAIVAGLCCAFYLLPVMTFQHLVHLEYVSSFGTLGWFGVPFWNKLLRGTTIIESLFDLVLIILTIAAIMLLSRNGPEKRMRRSWILVLSVVFLLQIPIIALPLVTGIPLLDLIQFPSRLFCFTELGVGVAMVFAIHSHRITLAYFLAIGAALSVILIGTIFLFGHSVFRLSEFPIEQKTHWSAFEYVPRWVPGDNASVQAYALQHQNDPEISSIGALPANDTLDLVSTAGATTLYQVSIRDSLAVRFHRFYWPQWELFMRNGVHPNTYSDRNGILCTVLPPGSYRVELKIIHTSSECLGDQLTLLGTVIVLIGILSSNIRKKNGGGFRYSLLSAKRVIDAPEERFPID